MADAMVIDTSVVAKWFLRHEDDTDLADDVLVGLLAGDFEGHVPRIASYEVCSVLAKACKSKSNSSNRRMTMDTAIAFVREFFNLPLTTHDASLDEGIEALQMAVEYSQSHYDMTYLRLASKLNCRWCTADEKVLKANPPTFPTDKVVLLSDFQT